MGEPPIFFLTEAGVYQKLRWNPIARALSRQKAALKKPFRLRQLAPRSGHPSSGCIRAFPASALREEILKKSPYSLYIWFVEAQPAVYVAYHQQLVEAVESCAHVEQGLSIDEMYCERKTTTDRRVMPLRD